MADNETSKIVWIAIVVALAATIYFFAQPAINKLASDVFQKVTDLVTSMISGIFG